MLEPSTRTSRKMYLNTRKQVTTRAAMRASVHLGLRPIKIVRNHRGRVDLLASSVMVNHQFKRTTGRKLRGVGPSRKCRMRYRWHGGRSSACPSPDFAPGGIDISCNKTIQIFLGRQTNRL